MAEIKEYITGIRMFTSFSHLPGYLEAIDIWKFCSQDIKKGYVAHNSVTTRLINILLRSLSISM